MTHDRTPGNGETGQPAQMNDLLALSYVPRWTIVPHSRPQSVAEHTHRVMVILLELASRLDLRVPYPLLVWALVHDGPESWTGDIPGPFKHPEQTAHERQKMPWWAAYRDAVGAEWYALFKLADLIETGTFIRKFGIGMHATYAANHILNIELTDAVELAACRFTGWGPQKMLSIVRRLTDDIGSEVGRCAFD